MKNKILVLSFITSFYAGYSQNNITKRDFIGVWQYKGSNYSYEIANKDSVLVIRKLDEKFSYYIQDFGFVKKEIDFQKHKDSIGQVQTYNFYWGISDGKVVPEFHNGKLIAFEIENQNVHGFERIEKLPDDYNNFLSRKGFFLKRDFLKEFNLNTSSFKRIKVISPKCYFYKEPSENTLRKAYIIKGDQATLLESKGDWLYIEYQGKNIVKGWVKGKDVKNL